MTHSPLPSTHRQGTFLYPASASPPEKGKSHEARGRNTLQARTQHVASAYGTRCEHGRNTLRPQTQRVARNELYFPGKSLSLFHEDRMRFGRNKKENCVFILPLRSPFTIFVPRRQDAVRQSQHRKLRFHFVSALTFHYLCHPAGETMPPHVPTRKTKNNKIWTKKKSSSRETAPPDVST